MTLPGETFNIPITKWEAEGLLNSLQEHDFNEDKDFELVKKP